MHFNASKYFMYAGLFFLDLKNLKKIEVATVELPDLKVAVLGQQGGRVPQAFNPLFRPRVRNFKEAHPLASRTNESDY